MAALLVPYSLAERQENGFFKENTGICKQLEGKDINAVVQWLDFYKEFPNFFLVTVRL